MERTCFWVQRRHLTAAHPGGRDAAQVIEMFTHLAELAVAQRALDAEREKVAFLEKKNANLIEASNLVLKVKAEQDAQLATLQAQLRQAEGDRQTLRQLVAALPVVEVDGVIVWAAPDESGWFVSKRPAPTGTYWAKFKTQEDAKSFLALLKSRATLAAQDAGQGGLQ